MTVRNKNTGFTLVEILLVTGFIATATIGVYNIYAKAKEKSFAASEVKTIIELQDGISEAYDGLPNYTGLSAASLNAQNVSPVNLRTSNPSELVSKHGPVTFTVMSVWGITDVAYRINYLTDTASCPYVVISLLDKFDTVQVNYNSITTWTSPAAAPATIAAYCADNYGLPYVELQLDTIKFHRRATLAAVPPLAPSTRTQFDNTFSGLVCDFDDASFNYGAAAIPHNVRNALIVSFRNVDNHVGRCPNNTEYQSWIDRISSEKSANPALTYLDIFTNIVEPELINYGTTSYIKATRIAAADSECQSAAAAKYGAFASTARYVLYSGNKCKI